jgi:hypothetical protein
MFYGEFVINRKTKRVGDFIMAKQSFGNGSLFAHVSDRRAEKSGRGMSLLLGAMFLMTLIAVPLYFYFA